MYDLIQIQDLTTNFIGYIITKNIQKTIHSINHILSSKQYYNYDNEIISYLIKNNKKLSELNINVIFSNDSLLVVNNYLNSIKNPDTKKDATISLVKEAKPQQTMVVVIVEENIVSENIVSEETEKSTPAVTKKRQSKKTVE